MFTSSDLDRLVGRGRELEEVLDSLETARFLAITGPGGSGKTRLAEAVVERVLGSGTDAWFVDVSSIADADLIASVITTALKVDAGPATNPLDAVRETVGDRRALIALDNVEQIPAAGPAITALLAAIPGLRIIATSRTRIGIRGEVEVPLGGLALPDDGTPEAVERSEAGALFLARARAAGRMRQIDGEVAADIQRLLARLDGLPLAIELAAARTRVLSPGEVVARLDSHGIRAIDSGGDEHRGSMSRIIDWTRGLLSPEETVVLEAATLCAGFDIGMIELIVPDIDAVEAIDGLLRLGLVRHAGEVHGTTRFRVLEVVRAQVRSTLQPENERLFADRHAKAVLLMVEDQVQADDRTPEPRDRLDVEADNIRQALDRLDVIDPSRSLDLWTRLFYPFWGTRARLREGLARFERTAALVASPTVSLSRAMVLYAMNRAWVADEQSTRASMERALTVAQEVGDGGSAIEVLAALGGAALNEGDEALARRVAAALDDIDVTSLEPALAMRVAEARSHSLAVLEGSASDESLAALLEAARLAAVAQRPQTGVSIEGNLAIAYLHRREFSEAAHAAERSVVLARRVASPLLPWALSLMAMANAEAGHLETAVAALAECVKETVERDFAVQTGDSLLAAMPVACASGHPLDAARLWGAAMALEAAGVTEYPPGDRELAGRTLDRVRRHSRPVDVELAIRDGGASDPLQLLASLPAILATSPASSEGLTVRLRHADLTAREIEILALVGQGKSDTEIGAQLFISPKTASVHVANIKSKLALGSRLEIALRAREMGLLEAATDAEHD